MKQEKTHQATNKTKNPSGEQQSISTTGSKVSKGVGGKAGAEPDKSSSAVTIAKQPNKARHASSKNDKNIKLNAGLIVKKYRFKGSLGKKMNNTRPATETHNKPPGSSSSPHIRKILVVYFIIYSYFFSYLKMFSFIITYPHLIVFQTNQNVLSP